MKSRIVKRNEIPADFFAGYDYTGKYQTGFSGRIAHCKIPYKSCGEVGIYTGEIEVEDGVAWFTVIDDKGREFQVTDEPVQIIDLTNAKVVSGSVDDILKELI